MSRGREAVGRQEISTDQRKHIFLGMLGTNSGHIGQACIAAGINRQTYYRWTEKDEYFAASCEEIQEALIDGAESKLHANINDGQNQAIIFFLKTKGKSRGYVERQEISGPDGRPLELINSITINLAVLTTKELEQLQQIAKKIREAADDGDENADGAGHGPGTDRQLIPFGGTPKLAARAGKS